MSSLQPSCELWMPYRKSEQRLCKRPLVALHIGLNTLQRRKPLNSAAPIELAGTKAMAIRLSDAEGLIGGTREASALEMRRG